jgi:serine/threonine protein kinase
VACFYESLIASGGFGMACRAWVVDDRVEVHRVAVKTHVSSHNLVQAHKDLASMEHIRHPNLASPAGTFYDEEKDILTCVYAYAVTDLSRFIGNTPRFADPRIVQGIPVSRWYRPPPQFVLQHLCFSLGKGLCALHASSHVHRDVKPANVLLMADGQVSNLAALPGIVGRVMKRVQAQHGKLLSK